VTFTPQQLAELQADLSRANVKQRKQAGRQLSYIEGWWAEAEANRIFGHHAWDSETIDLRMVSEKPRKIGDAGVDGWAVSYLCRVRVTVTTPDGHEIIRDGVGAGHGIDRDLGLAHESALKEAATDAEKRALKTFGNPFGLALYDKTQAHVSDAPPRPAGVITGRQLQEAQERPEYDPEPPLGSNRLTSFEATRQGLGESIKNFIDGASAKELDLWEKNFDRNTGHLPVAWLEPLRDRIEARREELTGKANIAEGEAALEDGFRGAVGGPVHSERAASVPGRNGAQAVQ
jgi:hypothetical protein